MLSNKNDIVNKFTVNDITSPLAFKGRVINVRPATLSVDVYVSHTNKTYYGVYFGEGVLSRTYRSGGLPDIDSEVVMMSFSRTDAPIIIACVPPKQFNGGSSRFELIHPGEYQIMSSGMAYSKFDRVGNAYLGGANSASETKTFDGASVKYQKKDIDISNFSKKELRTEAKDDIISIYGTSDIYEKSDVSKYSADEILNDSTLKDKILNDAANIKAILFGGETAGEAPSGRTIFDCLQIVIDKALRLIDFETDFEIYKLRAQLIKLSYAGNHLAAEIFGENDFSIRLLDVSGDLVSGITMNADGGRLVGTWSNVAPSDVASFVVNITITENETITADQSYEDMIAAYNSGKTLLGILVDADGFKVQSACVCAGYGQITFSTVLFNTEFNLTCHDNNTWMLMQQTLDAPFIVILTLNEALDGVISSSADYQTIATEYLSGDSGNVVFEVHVFERGALGRTGTIHCVDGAFVGDFFLGDIKCSIVCTQEGNTTHWEICYTEVASKDYVDEQIGDIETALDNIIAKYGLEYNNGERAI